MTNLKRIGFGLILLLCGVALLAAAGIMLLNTNFAHRYLLRLVIEQAQEAISGPVEIGSVSFHLRPMSADFYRITVRGSQPSAVLPLFIADRVGIRLRLHPFQRRKWTIENLALDHPAMHLLISSNGRSNLPQSNNRASGASPSPFDLAIGHLEINQGELFYNDRRIPIAADVRDLNARAEYHVLAKSYHATLSYLDGRVRYGSLNPFTHQLQVSLTADAAGVAIESLALEAGTSWVKAQGTIGGYRASQINGTYEASVSAADLTQLLPPAGSHQSISGRINTHGTASYRSRENRQALDTLTMSGEVSGSAATFISPRFRVAMQSVAAEYVLDHGNLNVRQLEAELLGGHLSGRGSISQLSGRAAARMEADVRGISLSALQSAVQLESLPDVRVHGTADGNIRATWNGSMNNVQLLSKASLAGTVAPSPGSPYGASFPVSGALQAAYDASKRTIAFRDSRLNTNHSRLTLDGSFGNDADVQINARSDDLREVGLMVLAFRPASSVGQAGSSPSPLLKLAGQGSFEGLVKGPLANPEIAGSLQGTNVRVGGTTIAGLRGAVRASRDGLVARQAELGIGSRGRAEFDASIGLQNWAFAPAQPVKLILTAEQLSLSDLQNIAGRQYPISGSVAASLSINGTGQNPNAQGNLRLTQAELWRQPVKDLSIGLKNAGDSLEAILHIQIPAGAASGTLRYDPKSQDYDLQANSSQVQLNQVQYFQEHAKKIAGSLNISVTGRGNMRSPQLDARFDSPKLQIGEQEIDSFTAQASVAQQKAAFDVAAGVTGANFRTHGTMDLTGDFQMTASIDSELIPLNSILATLLPQAAADIHGSTQLRGTLSGPLKNPARLEAHLDVPSFEVGYASLQFALATPARLDYQHGVLALKRTELKGSGTDVVLEGSVPVQASGELRASANGTVDLQLLQLLNREWQTSGRLDVRIAAQGSHTNPQISGTATVQNGSISTGADVPALEKINGELDITNERVQVKTLSGAMGGGDFEVGGFATYRPDVQFNLITKARRVRVLYPDGIRTILTGNLNLIGGPCSSNLTGQVTVDRLSLTQSFDLASFGSDLGAQSAPSTGMAQNVKLNVAVSSSQELQVASSQLSVEGSAELRIRGTLAEPVVIGRTNLTGGEVFFNARRFQIENATIEFANPVRTQPVVNLTATTTVNQFNLSINLVGPFDRLRATYMSDPPLPPVDVINLLITGQTTEAAQTSSTTPMSLLAGQLGAQASGRLQKLTGISSLTIDPQIGGNQGNAASQLAIQERVTKNLFFTFATDVTTTQGQVVQVEYQVTRKYSVSAIRDQTGGYEIQIKGHKNF